MGKPLAKRTIKAMAYIKEHPDAPVVAIAAKFNMALSRVYQLRKRVREEALTAEVNEGLKKMEWKVSATDDDQIVAKQEEAPAAPKRLYVPHAAAMIAEKLGIPLEEYVKRIREQNPTAFEETNDQTPDEDDEDDDTPSVDDILNERAKDYGKFIEGAEIMQMLKRMVHNYVDVRGTQLAFDQREAIDMIIHKLGRIINGNPDKADSWRDVAGYATLVADRLEGNVR